MGNLLYKDESFKIIGSALEVHKRLGCGFLEKVYQEALEIEFQYDGIPYEREKNIQINYRGKTLEQTYIADFICYNGIIVELKATKSIEDVHQLQVINYLRASKMKLGLLINFGEKSLTYKRFVNETIP